MQPNDKSETAVFSAYSFPLNPKIAVPLKTFFFYLSKVCSLHLDIIQKDN